MRTLTLPQARIPLGWATVAGQRVAVEIDMEWMRALLVLVERAGGVTGADGLAALVDSLLAQPPVTDPEAHAAMRAAQEAMAEIEGLRADNAQLRHRLEELGEQLQHTARGDDLRQRIEQLEGITA